MHDLTWRNSIQGSTGPVDMLLLDGMEVARLHQNVTTGAWFVTLDQHLAYERRHNHDCTSYEAGKAGAEMWAKRHEEQIRREIEERRARRRR
ncbi:hypothetical protein [Pseudoxanthomonas sp. CF125]|uniref:hypothetical protein n=1 Tax=Pseudoxanthomonas sp. CF125 TaxID=1855303 RepID=UPI00087FD12C|nr:hypothetical protein [Pseudoxanthomonas sp. CF125]SDQ41814.1 hypothetical protein SAMN05216569_1049 [Pseudoxanthomonas sp. CF125]